MIHRRSGQPSAGLLLHNPQQRQNRACLTARRIFRDVRSGPLELYGPLAVNENLPPDAAHAQIFTNTYVSTLDGRFAWNLYESPGTILRYWQNGPGGLLSVMTDGSLQYQVAPSGTADTPASLSTLMTLYASGQTRFYGPVSANETMPGNASHAEFFASNYVASGNLAFNIYTAAGVIPSYWQNGPGGELSMMSDGGLQYAVVPSGTAGNPVGTPTPVMTLSATGQMTLADTLIVAHGPAPTDPGTTVATRDYVDHSLGFAFNVTATSPPPAPPAYMWLNPTTRVLSIWDGSVWRVIGTVT